MKRFLTLLCALCLLAGINAQTPRKALVAYFSATGTTETVARQLATAAHADLYAITPKAAYTAADLDWHDKQSRSSVEMNDPQSRPDLKDATQDLRQYDVIYLGFPIWWGVAPRIINTFIEANSLEGKTLIPFATSGGSGISGAVKALRTSYPKLRFQDGKLLNGTSKGDIQQLVRL